MFYIHGPESNFSHKENIKVVSVKIMCRFLRPCSDLVLTSVLIDAITGGQYRCESTQDALRSRHSDHL